MVSLTKKVDLTKRPTPKRKVDLWKRVHADISKHK